MADTRSQEQAEIAAAQKNRSAFAPLYERYADAVYGYCLRRLSDPEQAADTTAEVFTRAMATIGKFHGTSFRSWIFTIAHNAVIDRAADRNRISRSSVVDADCGSGMRGQCLSASCTFQ